MSILLDGEAGLELSKDNEILKKLIRRLAYNTYHLARILKNTPVPEEGNTLD